MERELGRAIKISSDRPAQRCPQRRSGITRLAGGTDPETPSLHLGDQHAFRATFPPAGQSSLSYGLLHRVAKGAFEELCMRRDRRTEGDIICTWLMTSQVSSGGSALAFHRRPPSPFPTFCPPTPSPHPSHTWVA